MTVPHAGKVIFYISGQASKAVNISFFKGPYYNEYIKIRNMAACRRGGRLQGGK